jgi:PmbA protein
LTLVDRPRTPGRIGSKLFDSEGVATKEAPIIEGGIVRTYFVNTHIARKMNIAPTVEEALRPVLLPYLSPVLGVRPDALDRKAILAKVGNGILVTGFNGGNNNSSTGDFSYGIEGFLFEEGRITRPVREMLITGNFLTLWNHLLAAGDDARFCMSKLIPTLAFENVDFSS